MRQVPLTVWVHSIQLSLHWCIGMAYLNKCKPPTPQIDVYCNIQNVVTSSHSLCTTLFFICIKIPERTKTFTPWGSVLSLGNLQPWPLHMLPGALFTTLWHLWHSTVASEAASSCQGGCPPFCWHSCLASCFHKLWGSLVALRLKYCNESPETHVCAVINYNSPITTHEPVCCWNSAPLLLKLILIFPFPFYLPLKTYIYSRIRLTPNVSLYLSDSPFYLGPWRVWQKPPSNPAIPPISWQRV